MIVFNLLKDGKDKKVVIKGADIFLKEINRKNTEPK